MLLILTVVLTLMVLAGIVIVWQYGPRMKAFVVNAVHSNITTDVHFSDDVQISLWREFPRLAVELRNVVVQDAFRHDTLLMADRVFVQLDIIKVLTDRLSIEGIRVTHGFVHIRQNEKGDWNYAVWRETEPTEGGTDINIDLLALDRVAVDFDSESTGVQFNLYSEKAKMSGRFTEADQRMETSINGQLTQLSTNGMLRVQALPIDLRAVLAIHNRGRTIGVEMGNALVAGNELVWNMLLRNEDRELHLTLAVQGTGILPEELLPHVWPSMPQPVQNLGVRGRSDITLSIEGPLSGRQGPALHATWAMTDGGLTFRELPVTGIDFLAEIDLQDLNRPQDATFTFQHFKLGTPSGQVSGDGQLKDLQNPYLVLRSKGRTRLEELLIVIGQQERLEGKGAITWDIVFEGPLGDQFHTTKAELRKMRWTGSLQFSDVQLALGNGIPPLKDLHGLVAMEDAETRVTEFSGELGHLVFDGSMDVQQLREVLADSLHPLRLRADVSINEIDIQNLSKEWTMAPDGASTQQRPLQLTATVDVDRVKHHGFTAENLKGHIDLKEGGLQARDLRFDAMGGTISAELQYASGANGAELYVDAALSRIDISRMLSEWNDFGQTTITAKNLRGQADADIQLKLPIDKDDKLILSGMQVEADLRVSGGELIGFEPLQALSRFISVDELQHVRFDTIVNHFSIRNERLIIPYMRVKSNILNVDVYGEHTFKQELDYHVNLLLNDLIRRKSRKQEFFEGHEIIDDRGATRLFLWIRGRPGNIKVGFDKKEVRIKVKEDLRKEGGAIKQLFRDEFGGKKHHNADEVDSPGQLRLESEPVGLIPAAPKKTEPPAKKRKGLFSKDADEETEGEFRLEGAP
ncbi:MAG: AsmA-like C-terminal region-containing protein [Flavobacteriales bacterium]|nr:AsmA-like C-terminal region-containing protein [Flavobacteriales bacterium]